MRTIRVTGKGQIKLHPDTSRFTMTLEGIYMEYTDMLHHSSIEKSEAYKAGYRNICEIGKERIHRAGRKIKEEAGLAAPADLDIGFRCLRLDESNMEDVYYAPDELRQETLFSLVDNVKPD